MATAYAALVSLMNLLNRIQHPPCPVLLDNTELQSLLDKLSSLLGFLECYCSTETEETQGVIKTRITDVAYAMQDIVETYIVEDILEESACNRDKGYPLLFEDLHEAIQQIDLVKEAVEKIKEQKCEKDQLPKCSASFDSSLSYSGKSATVGLEEKLISLMDRLTGHQSVRQTIAIVGMGGIGKTTLAKSVYEHPFVVNYFHVRAWVTISQDYSVEGIILHLLRGISVRAVGDNTEQLGEKLYKCLLGRKYVIVLDDMWSSVVWEEIRRFLPNNGNGSRILLTTRLLNVAVGVGSCFYSEMGLLDDDKSWKLFSRKVFGEETCPPELQCLGQQIAKSCHGLPLAIVVIGGLLKMSQKTRQYWEDVVENVKSIINTGNDDDCFKILSLSYRHLPIHLKPCFLYMATFGEDDEISVSILIRLWISDGFLRPIKGKSLEEVAVRYLNDLTDRSLIMVGKQGFDGRTKSCILHDFIRDLCMREAEAERFLCVIQEDSVNLPETMKGERRFVTNVRVGAMRYSPEFVVHLPTTARSLVYKFSLSAPPTFGSSLLQVFHIDDGHTPKDIKRLVNLRYLAYSAESAQSNHFSSLSLLWNLETLVVHGISWDQDVILPSGIWELRHLRHLIFLSKVLLPDPAADNRDLFLSNLQTLYRIEDFSCTDETLNRIPSLKKLGIYYDMIKVSQNEKVSSYFSVLVNCHKLETLKCAFTAKRYCRCVFNDLETFRLSPSLRKLTLYNSNIPWEYMTIVGSLPNREVLKLEYYAFRGTEWNSIKGEFQRLKYLLMDWCDLATWNMESSHFPRLEHLHLRNMRLEEIPLGIGEVMSLKSIRLYICETSAIISAKEILEEQQSQGNDHFLIEVRVPSDSKEKAKLRCLVDDNTHFRIIFLQIDDGARIVCLDLSFRQPASKNKDSDEPNVASIEGFCRKLVLRVGDMCFVVL